MYPFGRPLSQAGQPQQQPPQPAPGGWGQLQYPGSRQGQPAYPPPSGGSHYAAQTPYARSRKGMPTWKIVLIVVIPLSLYAGFVVFSMLRTGEFGSSDPGYNDVAVEPGLDRPLKVYPEQHENEVYVGQRVRLRFLVNGGRAPYQWHPVNTDDDWMLESVGESASGLNLVLSGVFHGTGMHKLGVLVWDDAGEQCTGYTKMLARELPDEVGAIRISSGLVSNEPPWVNGDSFETYPMSQFSLRAYARCEDTSLTMQSAALTWYAPDLPDSVIVQENARLLRIKGFMNGAGEFKIRVKGDIRLRDFSQPVHRELIFTIRALAPPQSAWPKTPGKLTVQNPALTRGVYGVAGLVLNTPEYPYNHNAWPAHVDWSYSGDLPPGLEAQPGKLQWTAGGKPTKPGNYSVEVKGTVHFKWIDKTFEITRTLNIRVK
jgi:hypothetical protein